MKLDNKKTLVVGAGRSGISSALFMKKHGAAVCLNDLKSEAELAGTIELLSREGVEVVCGGHPTALFEAQDLIVISPGVPHDSEPFVRAREKGVEIIGELELAYRFISTPIIAITGTNGKTTTTSLLGEMIADSGSSVFVGGNIGTPLIEYAGDDSRDIAVVEVSSFQLETVSHFHPFGGILLNVTPDHLDRYSGMEAYAETKFRLFENQEPFDFAVLSDDDQWVVRFRPSVLSDISTFSTKKEVRKGAFYRNSKIFIRHPALGKEEQIEDSAIGIRGLHNMENAMAATVAALEAGVALESIRKTLERFRGLHHRVEFVTEVDGVQFYDDSKGTNVGAVEKALEGFGQPVVLILGGRDKGGDYDYLAGQIKRTVRAVVALGEAKEKICEQLKTVTDVVKVKTLADAVETAFSRAERGDAVLLSPACSSFDMFSGYVERGEKFVEEVRKLQERRSGKN